VHLRYKFNSHQVFGAVAGEAMQIFVVFVFSIFPVYLVRDLSIWICVSGDNRARGEIRAHSELKERRIRRPIRSICGEIAAQVGLPVFKF